MGFLLPTQDYIKSLLSRNNLCRIAADSRFIGTSEGEAIEDMAALGIVIYLLTDGLADDCCPVI
ncbi:hypothetical protein IW00_00025 [Pectobacterium brasiliense]|nr:hypothetical protein IW00_00025 [Pectobacterium brasiliense]